MMYKSPSALLLLILALDLRVVDGSKYCVKSSSHTTWFHDQPDLGYANLLCCYTNDCHDSKEDACKHQDEYRKMHGTCTKNKLSHVRGAHGAATNGIVSIHAIADFQTTLPLRWMRCHFQRRPSMATIWSCNKHLLAQRQET